MTPSKITGAQATERTATLRVSVKKKHTPTVSDGEIVKVRGVCARDARETS